MTRYHPDPNEPEPGEVVILVGPDGEESGQSTKIRKVISSDYDVQVHEVQDDRGQTIYIGHYTEPDTWIQVLEV